MANTVIPMGSEGTLDELFKKVTYTADYTVAANSTLSLTASDFGMAAISGYTPIAFVTITTNNNSVLIRSFYGGRTSSNILVIRNVAASVQTGKASIDVLFAKTSVM